MRHGIALAVLALAAPPARAAKLDLTTEVEGNFVAYKNLNLTAPASGGQSFFDHRARIQFALKGVSLAELRSDMDVAIGLTAIGIAGSTQAVEAPFSRAAERLPAVGLSPFLSTAYLRIRRLLDSEWNATLGRQPVLVGSGLLLSDDDVGFSGVILERPWWFDSRFSIYAFQPRASQGSGTNSNVYGLSIESPGEDGIWQLHNVLEDDGGSPLALGAPATSALRNLSSIRYLLKKGEFEFDGELAFQNGKAYFPGPDATLAGYAYMMRGRWRQPMGRLGTSQARMAFVWGTGDRGTTGAKDEAFFPSFGHRYRGLHRAGYGEFLGATPYDALALTTTTATGLPAGISGIQIVALGVTAPPTLRGVTLDADLLIFVANRTTAGASRLGHEWDLAARYEVQDKLALKLSYAIFRASAGLTAAVPSAKRLSLLAFGRF